MQASSSLNNCQDLLAASPVANHSIPPNISSISSRFFLLFVFFFSFSPVRAALVAGVESWGGGLASGPSILVSLASMV